MAIRSFGVHGLRRLGAELVSQTGGNLVASAQKQLHRVVDSYSLLVQAKEVKRALA